MSLIFGMVEISTRFFLLCIHGNFVFFTALLVDNASPSWQLVWWSTWVEVIVLCLDDATSHADLPLHCLGGNQDCSLGSVCFLLVVRPKYSHCRHLGGAQPFRIFHGFHSWAQEWWTWPPLHSFVLRGLCGVALQIGHTYKTIPALVKKWRKWRVIGSQRTHMLLAHDESVLCSLFPLNTPCPGNPWKALH